MLRNGHPLNDYERVQKTPTILPLFFTQNSELVSESFEVQKRNVFGNGELGQNCLLKYL